MRQFWLRILFSLGVILAAWISMRHYSRAAGLSLWPYSDAVEYASMAVWTSRGEGPLLRIGPAFFPARVPPLLSFCLLPQIWLFGEDVSHFYLFSFCCGLVALFFFFRICREFFLSETSCWSATLILAACPAFGKYSGWLMSDVPALMLLCMLVWLALRLERDDAKQLWLLWLLAGLATGLLAGLRSTRIIWPAFLAVPLLMRNRKKFGLPELMIAACGFLPIMVAILIYQAVYCGGISRTGYHYWIPDFTSSEGIYWHWAYAFIDVTTSGHPGNLLHYLQLLLGRGSALYSPLVALAGIAGLVLIFREREKEQAWKRFALPLLAALIVNLILYSIFLWQSPRFMLEALLIMSFACGYLLDGVSMRRLEHHRQRVMLNAAVVVIISVSGLFPLPGPDTLLLKWNHLVQSERLRLASAGDESGVFESALPLPYAALLVPANVVIMPREPQQPLPVREYHLNALREFDYTPYSIDEGREELYGQLKKKVE